MEVVLTTGHCALLKTKRYKGPPETLKTNLVEPVKTIYSMMKMTDMTWRCSKTWGWLHIYIFS